LLSPCYYQGSRAHVGRGGPAAPRTKERRYYLIKIEYQGSLAHVGHDGPAAPRTKERIDYLIKIVDDTKQPTLTIPHKTKVDNGTFAVNHHAISESTP
jgi:hypothetical protein